MPKPKPTDEDLEQREVRKREWLAFRKEFLFTQVKLADVLGISRRSVQLVESAKVTPLAQTLRAFNALKSRYDAGRAA
jgi:DNA-binding XRE family transcriptional regulator